VATGVYVDDIDTAVAKERATIRHEISVSITQYVAITLAFLTILLIAAFFMVNKYIAVPIETITRAMKNFNNDLTVTVPVYSDDEVGELARWLNEHIVGLRHLIGMVSEVTEKVYTQAGVIATSVDKQTEFATELSSSVAEISSTMEELSSTASQIALHSKEVVERADKTLVDTKHGAEEVENLTFKMNDISQDIQANLAEIVELGQKSKEINKVMEIINNIASQTKLIAFNAALEAASAGEAGKRFGVVAVEIRRLADNVVESTAEIEGKITEILDAVNRLVMSSEKSSQMTMDGQEYASHTVAVLIDIVDGVEETTAAARQISLSTQQQQIASSQVVLSLKDIEKGLRYSTDSIRDSNAVTDELAGLSEKLRSLVMSFNLGTLNAENKNSESVETGS
jgi:methyl-accepting chemotaxis protein